MLWSLLVVALEEDRPKAACQRCPRFVVSSEHVKKLPPPLDPMKAASRKKLPMHSPRYPSRPAEKKTPPHSRPGRSLLSPRPNEPRPDTAKLGNLAEAKMNCGRDHSAEEGALDSSLPYPVLANQADQASRVRPRCRRSA